MYVFYYLKGNKNINKNIKEKKKELPADINVNNCHTARNCETR
jgi:hypothetical protein